MNVRIATFAPFPSPRDATQTHSRTLKKSGNWGRTISRKTQKEHFGGKKYDR